MVHYFDATASSPLFIALSEALAYALAGLAGGYVLWRVCRELIASGHEPVSVARFALLFAAVAAPGAYLGYRAAALFQGPLEPWSSDFFLRAPSIDRTHSFDASVLLPFAWLTVLTRVWGYRTLQVMDAAFLALPIAHAMSRVGCLLLACCWGETIRLGIPGFQAAFLNPTPLYWIVIDLLIFALLREIFRVIHPGAGAAARRRYEGTVFGGYLVLYGAGQLVMESFPHQELFLWRLSAVQLLMLGFVGSGSWILWLVHSRSRSDSLGPDPDEAARRAMARLLSILGVVATYLVLIFVFHYLTRRTHILPTPFHRAGSIADAYTRVLFCMPLVFPAVAGLFFYARAGESVRPFLRWPGASPLFGLALLVSGLYAGSMLFRQGSPMPGWVYWPPVLILSAVNSLSEEVIHRLVVLRLLLVSGVAEWASLGIQSALYSLVHFMISPSLGLMSFAYGLLLGLVMVRKRSLPACVLCHFVLDLGAIGGPLLLR